MLDLRTPSALREIVRARFKASLESAYDASEALTAFWIYAKQLAKFEFESLMAAGQRDSMDVIRRLTAIKKLTEIDNQSIAAGGMSSDQVARLGRVAEECAACRLSDTGEGLQRVRAVCDMLAHDPPENSWCQQEVRELECPGCHHTARYLFRNVINTTLRGELRAEAKEGRLRNEAKCCKCDTVIEKREFFYCDPQREEFLIFWPYRDNPDISQAFEFYRRILDKMPMEMRGGKSVIVAIQGMPVTTFAEPEVAAITACHTDEEFDSVVNDEVYLNVSYGGSLGTDYFAAKNHVAKSQWQPAASAFARAFLKDQVGISFLAPLVSCLRNMDRTVQADRLASEAERLHTTMLSHHLIKRIQRKSGPGGLGSRGEALWFEISSKGLPVEWGFGGMLSELREIANEQQ